MKISWKKEIGKDERLGAREIVDIILANRHIKDSKEFLLPTSPLEIPLSTFGFKKNGKRQSNFLRSIKRK